MCISNSSQSKLPPCDPAVEPIRRRFFEDYQDYKKAGNEIENFDLDDTAYLAIVNHFSTFCMVIATADVAKKQAEDGGALESMMRGAWGQALRVACCNGDEASAEQYW